MVTYNLFNTEKQLLELALNVLIQSYDQYKIKDPAVLKSLRAKIRNSTKITLLTEVKKGK